MPLINPEYQKPSKKTRVLKKSTTGLELEYHLIDGKGRIAKNGQYITKQLAKFDSSQVVQEIATNMVEFLCYPGVATYNPLLDMASSLDNALHHYTKNNLHLYPFATYPGSFTPIINPDKKYRIKQKILGKEKTLHTGRVVGYHFHYALPKGVFDPVAKTLKHSKQSKLSRTLVSNYNLAIAADPVLTLFMQSSPFYQGSHIAKDSRMIVYRGGNRLRSPEGVYSGMQQLGGLPSYKHTGTDIISYLSKQQQRWKKEIRKVSPRTNFDSLYPDKLDIGWQPVKINKHGTLELRGMDTNLFSLVAPVALLMKFALRMIQRDFIEVLPADMGMERAFKLENGILHVPPQSYVRGKLQMWSAYEGFKSTALYDYAKQFWNFAKPIVPKRYAKILQPIQHMIDEKKSISDEIIQYAKKRGYVQGNTISDGDAAELALYYAEKFPYNLQETIQQIDKAVST